ncbi:hypothetical protein RUM44_002067 [Polyplax serrata]|uniref:E3 ubiquitin-protein transferase MAEA n=1 Tax=Polyplax serrata TaxID=468196 RepID=A0ABR1ALU6_POLSC
MADVKSLEHPTLKVPYELLNKKFRAAQKTLDREVSHVQAAALDLEKGLQDETVGAGEISRLLGGMVERLQVFKRKAEESISEELQAGYVCKRRLEHLKEAVGDTNSATVAQWRRARLDRMLVEYFLRQGYYGSATCLAHSSQLRDLTNIDVFLVSREVENSLAEHETSKCLAWCHDNKSKLRKLKSSMEFNIRIQEFVELIRADRRVDAVKHARKHLSTCEKDQLPAVQHAMALLALPLTTQLSPYKELLSLERWDRLIEQFRQENYRLFQLSPQSTFTVTLQAGLSALKTPYPFMHFDIIKFAPFNSAHLANHMHFIGAKEFRNSSCPVCQDNLNQLAANLPFANCSQSRLICAISGRPLNEHNTPMALPNGYVYGDEALSQMAAENNGQVICPKTKEVYPYKKLEKVYVM